MGDRGGDAVPGRQKGRGSGRPAVEASHPQGRGSDSGQERNRTGAVQARSLGSRRTADAALPGTSVPEGEVMGAGISRRTLLCGLAAGAAGRAALAPAMEVYLSPAGRDTNPGTKARPLRTLSAAQQAARKLKGKGPVTVWLRAG